jgi:hypothetical protein
MEFKNIILENKLSNNDVFELQEDFSEFGIRVFLEK